MAHKAKGKGGCRAAYSIGNSLSDNLCFEGCEIRDTPRCFAGGGPNMSDLHSLALAKARLSKYLSGMRSTKETQRKAYNMVDSVLDK